tara:strand:- start:1291 stop:1677 length:387 start_codon:yes stop_codon:yes gene_type:complete
MFQRKSRGFRRRSNGRNRSSHENGFMQSRQRSNSFSNNQIRNNFRHTQSAERLFEKYTALAKEAMSSGDKTLGENYLQHADHFMRILEDKNKNKDQNKIEAANKSSIDQKPLLEDSNIKQEDLIKNKE